jgi:hypothetical protein
MAVIHLQPGLVEHSEDVLVEQLASQLDFNLDHALSFNSYIAGKSCSTSKLDSRLLVPFFTSCYLHL